MDCIATKINGKFKLIKYHKNELDDINEFLIKSEYYYGIITVFFFRRKKRKVTSNFLVLVLIAHGVSADDFEVIVRDQNKMRIDLNDLVLLMEKFHGCSHFHIELLVKNLDDAIPLELKEVRSRLRKKI